MNTVSIPKTCVQSVKTVSEELHIDSETAYAMLAIQAILNDTSPSDERLVDDLINQCKPCG